VRGRKCKTRVGGRTDVEEETVRGENRLVLTVTNERGRVVNRGSEKRRLKTFSCLIRRGRLEAYKVSAQKKGGDLGGATCRKRRYRAQK